MLEINILRNSTQKNLGVLRGAFYGFGCPKRHPDALLAKTMHNSPIRINYVKASSLAERFKNLQKVLYT